MQKSHIIQAARRLSPEERREVIEAMLEEDDVLRRIIELRKADIDAGKASSLTLDEFREAFRP